MEQIICEIPDGTIETGIDRIEKTLDGNQSNFGYVGAKQCGVPLRKFQWKLIENILNPPRGKHVIKENKNLFKYEKCPDILSKKSILFLLFLLT